MKIEKLVEFIKDSTEAVLITSDVNRKYFSGFNSSAGVMFITADESYLLVDFRYGEAAKQQVKDCKVIVFSKLFDSLNELIKKHNINKLYVETNSMSVFDFNMYGEKLHDTKLLKDNSLVSLINTLRCVKTEDEIEKIIQAQKITEDSFNEILNYIKPGVSERKIALELECLMKQKGAEKIAFDLITITGVKTSLPHGVPDDTKIKKGDFFTMDIGAVFEGYHSDMTRTVAVGFVSDRQKEIYNIVLDAQLNAVSAIKSGIMCSDVDLAARNIIENSGYGEFFGHSTGHGVGLEIHESPTVYKTNNLTLRENMVITVEPGIYLPDEFGVRIEDMVCVKENGAFNLTNVSKDLLII